ncbi:hypothetical protein FAZ19_23525 [Sphingobacterium alkalisoli]|uniref:Uncharacterized protein n=1 Tax=Sphingobacterium alkalisoli TaxID=1874115 RepID=A0A4U0GQ87_9SPHI|nr:hypothetical protein [Sphingobacterium alkalisoli]TJY59712.1 hypothetical protein FAZ19_23525 [Sphingobacterium alkalisoli]GGH32988.1 hypothetical protein GCM10011418_46890 [Sphingobacterium alkalisoli]
MSKTAKRLNTQEERKIVSRAAKKASSTAFRISTALELPIQIVQGKKIVLKEANGTTRELKKINQVKSRIALTKGTKICLQPKC